MLKTSRPLSWRMVLSLTTAVLLGCTPKTTVDQINSSLNQSQELQTRKFQVEFEANNDAVMLRGYADTRNTRDLIISLVQSTEGVSKVDSNIEVLGSKYTALSDTRLALERITRQLEKSLLDDDSKIYVTLANRKATVTGATKLHEQRVAIEELVLRDPYVKEIRSSIKIGSLRPDIAIKKDILSALDEKEDVSKDKIKVVVYDGMVTIHGDQPTFKAVDDLLTTILNVDGVIAIESNMKVAGKPYPVQKFNSQS